MAPSFVGFEEVFGFEIEFEIQPTLIFAHFARSTDVIIRLVIA